MEPFRYVNARAMVTICTRQIFIKKNTEYYIRVGFSKRMIGHWLVRLLGIALRTVPFEAGHWLFEVSRSQAKRDRRVCDK